MFKTIKDLEKKIESLDKTFGMCKVRLIHEGGEGEGIWAVPADADSKAKLDNDASIDEYAFVRLCNMPLGWNGLSWGGLVRVKTAGSDRAVGNLDEQNLAELREDRKNLSKLIAEELAKEKK